MRAGSVLRREVLRRHCRLSDADTIAPLIDVGGFDGSVTAQITSGTAKTTSGACRIVVDVDKSGLMKVPLYGGLPVLASVRSVPIRSRSAGAVLCLDVLPCVPNDLPVDIFRALRSTLRQNGKLIVTEVDVDFRLPFTDQHTTFVRWGVQRLIDKRELLTSIEDAGYRIELTRPFYGLLARATYSAFFIRNVPRRGDRIKRRLWMLIARLDTLIPLRPQATFVLAVKDSELDDS